MTTLAMDPSDTPNTPAPEATAAPAETAAPPRRLGLWVPWAAFAGLMVGYFGYWTVLKDEGLKRLAAWDAAQEAAATGYGYETVRAGGFPFRLTYKLTGVAFGGPGGVKVEAPALTLHVNPSNPRQLLGQPDARLRTAFPDGRVFLVEGAPLKFSVRGFGTPRPRVILEARKLTAFAEGQDAPAMVAEKVIAATRPDPRAPDARQATLEVEGAVFDTPPFLMTGLGATVQRFKIAAALPPARDGDPLRAFAAGETEARIEALDAAWGRAAATGKGAVRLEAPQRPGGSFMLTFADHRTALAAVAQKDALTPESRGRLLALAAGPAADFPLTLSGGRAYLAGAEVHRPKDAAE